MVRNILSTEVDYLLIILRFDCPSILTNIFLEYSKEQLEALANICKYICCHISDLIATQGQF